MSVKQPKSNDDEKENQSEQKQAESNIDDWLDSFEPSNPSENKSRSNTTIKKSVTSVKQDSFKEPKSISSSQLDQLLAEFSRELPNWINKPWMYVKPSHEGHLNNWYQSWKDLVLKYTETLTIHIVNIYDLKEVHPFTHKTSGRELSIPQVRYIIDTMVSDNLANWLDDDNIRARIYYNTDEEWAEIIYQYTLDHGYALDVMTFYELQNLGEPWSSLPDSELRKILSILVRQDKAEWVGSDKDTIQFKVN